MSPLVINFVPFGSKAPSAVLALKGLFSSVCAQVVPQTCSLREVPLAALNCAFVHLRFFTTLIWREIGRTNFGMDPACLSLTWLTVMPAYVQIFSAFLIKHLLVLGALRVPLLVKH